MNRFCNVINKNNNLSWSVAKTVTMSVCVAPNDYIAVISAVLWLIAEAICQTLNHTPKDVNSRLRLKNWNYPFKCITMVV